MDGQSYGLLRSSVFPSGSSKPAEMNVRSSSTGSMEESMVDAAAVCCYGASDEDTAALDQMDSVFDEIESILRQNSQNVAVTGATGHSYSSTSVMTYTNDNNGVPKLFQATIATRLAPGARETRKAIRDSVSGLEKTSVDRQLGERGHVEERRFCHVTGQREEQIDFINMDERDTEDFEQEWKRILETPLKASSTADKQEGTADSTSNVCHLSTTRANVRVIQQPNDLTGITTNEIGPF